MRTIILDDGAIVFTELFLSFGERVLQPIKSNDLIPIPFIIAVKLMIFHFLKDVNQFRRYLIALDAVGSA